MNMPRIRPLLRHSRRCRVALLIVLLALLAAGACRNGQDASQASTTRANRPHATLLVFAPASMTDVLREVGNVYAEEEGVTIRFSFASSSTLAEQIVQGAEPDLFLTANEDWIRYVERAGLVSTPRPFSANSLVIVVPRGSIQGSQTPEILLDPRVRTVAMGDPQAVPAGTYGKQSLQHLGLWDRVAPKVVPAGDIRTALAYVASEAADAGIVFATDAAAGRERVEIVCTLSAEATTPIRYWLATVRSTKQPQDAEALADYLIGVRGQEILQRHGFMPLDGDPLEP